MAHHQHRIDVGAAPPVLGTVPVVAVTASVMPQDRNKIMEAGFDAYIGKPINLKEFLDTVRTMLERGPG